MNRRAHLYLWSCVLWVGGALFGGGFAAAQTVDPRLEKTLADWQQRQERIKSIRYGVRGEHVYPKGSGTDPTGVVRKADSPPRDVAGEVNWLILFDFTTGRHHREVSQQLYQAETGQLYPRVTVDVFDGRALKGAMPREANTSPAYTPPVSSPDMRITTGNLRNAAFMATYFPVLLGHGLIHTFEAPIIPGKLKKKLSPDSFYIQGTGVQDGRPCLVVRSQSLQLAISTFGEFWVDSARDSAVVRYTQYVAEKPANDMVIQYQATAHGWLPERWTYTSYAGGRTNYLERMRVEELTVEPPFTDADFQMEPTPGMLVEESSMGGSPDSLAPPPGETKVYRLEDRGQRREVADPFGRDQDPGKKGWPVWAWGVAGTLTAIACLLTGFLFYRWRRRRFAES